MRFFESNNYTRTDISIQRTVPSKKIKLTTTQSLSNIPKNTPSSSATYPISFSVADLLLAERIARSREEVEALLVLKFSIYTYTYMYIYIYIYIYIYKEQSLKMDPRMFHIWQKNLQVEVFVMHSQYTPRIWRNAEW